MSNRKKRGRPRSPKLRRKRAIAASNQLSGILSTPWNHDESMVNTAAVDMWRLGRRHQIGIHSAQKNWICRSCRTPLRPGISARVRIRNQIRITTCLRCGRIYRKNTSKRGVE